MHCTTQSRTPVYAAPEMYDDVIDGKVEISPAVDYYSLGIMLMILWLGRNPLDTNERMIIKRKSEGRLPGVCELPDRVRLIVQGLTSVNPETRWTYEQIERWFMGESPKVDITSPHLKYCSFVVDPEPNLVADNINELIPLLLDNERTACGYLYSGKISEWMAQCGNTKLSIALDDIVKNLYPADQKAGLMAAVYTMDPAYPYIDISGNECRNVHEIAISMLSHADEYIALLANRNDNLYVYLETHSVCDVNRIRGYFSSGDIRNGKKALMCAVYEIDVDMPMFEGRPSSTLKDIVRVFGGSDVSEDDWEAVTDGRLLSWMYRHEGGIAYCVTICVGGNISAMKNLLIAYLNSVVLMGVFVIMQSCTDGWSYWMKYKDVLTLIVKKIKNVLVFMICVLPLIGSAEYLGLLRLMNLMTERY